MEGEADLWARLGLGVQMAALLRLLAEYFRLGPAGSPDADPEVLDHFVTAALVTAVLASVSLGLIAFGLHLAAAAVSALTVAMLLAYKFVVMA